MAPDEWTTEVAKLYRMRSAGKTDRRSLAGSILFISGQDGRQRHPSPLPPVDKISVFSGQMTKPKNIPPLTDKELEKLSPEELRAELRYLRAENAYLKKLKALVQSEKNGKKP